MPDWNQRIKTLLTLFLPSLLVFSLAACAGEESDKAGFKKGVQAEDVFTPEQHPWAELAGELEVSPRAEEIWGNPAVQDGLEVAVAFAHELGTAFPVLEEGGGSGGLEALTGYGNEELWAKTGTTGEPTWEAEDSAERSGVRWAYPQAVFLSKDGESSPAFEFHRHSLENDVGMIAVESVEVQSEARPVTDSKSERTLVPDIREIYDQDDTGKSNPYLSFTYEYDVKITGLNDKDEEVSQTFVFQNVIWLRLEQTGAWSVSEVLVTPGWGLPR